MSLLIVLLVVGYIVIAGIATAISSEISEYPNGEVTGADIAVGMFWPFFLPVFLIFSTIWTIGYGPYLGTKWVIEKVRGRL